MIRNTRAINHHFMHPKKAGRVTVKHPTKDIPIGRLRNIYRQAEWKWEDR